MPKDVKFISLEEIVEKFMKDYKDNEYTKYTAHYSTTHDALVIVIDLDEPIFKEDYILKNHKCQECDSILYFYEDSKRVKCCKCGTVYDAKRYCGTCKRAWHEEDGIRCEHLWNNHNYRECPEIELKKMS